MNNKVEYITKSEIKKRGWTEAMVNKFLKEPDAKKPNPYYKSAAPMALYDIHRVWNVEKSKSFKQEKEKSDRRRLASEKAVKTKMEKAIQFAQTVEIHVPIMEYYEVVKRACDSYNDYHHYLFVFMGHEYIEADPINSNEDFLARITTNYLRHECTCYERQLHNLYGKTGIQEAHDILQSRVNDEILKAYPQLK